MKLAERQLAIDIHCQHEFIMCPGFATRHYSDSVSSNRSDFRKDLTQFAPIAMIWRHLKNAEHAQKNFPAWSPPHGHHRDAYEIIPNLMQGTSGTPMKSCV